MKRQDRGFHLGSAVFDPKHPEALKDGFLWSAGVPGVPGATMVAGTAAWLALDSQSDVAKVNADKLRACLKKQGAIIL